MCNISSTCSLQSEMIQNTIHTKTKCYGSVCNGCIFKVHTILLEPNNKILLVKIMKKNVQK